jgi:hypothetical protein
MATECAELRPSSVVHFSYASLLEGPKVPPAGSAKVPVNFNRFRRGIDWSHWRVCVGKLGAGRSETSLLFSVIAPSLTISTEGDAHRVSMPVDSPVAWFTDRPERVAGSFDMNAFVSIWDAEGFNVDPPNAALAVTVNGEQHQHVVELSDPKVEGAMVSFHSVDVGDDESTDPVAGRSATHDVAVGTFGPSELFIDSASTSPCPSSITTSNFSPCLLAVGATLSFKVTTPYDDQVLRVTKTVSTSNTSVVYELPTGSLGYTMIGSTQYWGVRYTSGQLWKIDSITPKAVTVSFVTESFGPSDPADPADPERP